MQISILLNNVKVTDDVTAEMTLLEFVRNHDAKSVRCGCDTSNCGACTVLLNGKPVLSCSVLAVRADGCNVTTLEGVQKLALEIGKNIASFGAEQCGFCNPGYILNMISLLEENPNPTDEEIKEYLEGNLCRCSGYEGQLKGIRKYLNERGER